MGGRGKGAGAAGPGHLGADGGEGILVREGSEITSVRDLVGRKVAVNKGGTVEYLLLKALAKAGIPADKVERVYLRPDQ
ncbi:ABC transporter substrate-binding protein, partial [Streptomyces sp. NRRL B-24572]|uniref:ABC transporter substrate-binding protein n=1 Tax=Streptomyces sp. NRRL B-24572 TaxID=1962156 RepID=UPI00358E512F